MSTLNVIAQQLKKTKNPISLVYAFNSMGKTRLSVEYKNITKNPETGQHAGVYYNAYSEDLFHWNNDEENDNADISLEIVRSSLNQFHSLLSVDLLKEKLTPYHPPYSFVFNVDPNPEKGIRSISFLAEGGKSPIKISRGEERIFIWCFFLALFEVDAWSGVQNAHIYIDDPVSSLDEHNIHITADSICDLAEKYLLKKDLFISTHHIGLYSILMDRFTQGGKAKRYKNQTKTFILSNKNGDMTLSEQNGPFLFHLHLLQTLEKASNEKLYSYQFVLLRQLLETISSFLGKGGIGYALSQIGVESFEDTGNTINSLSHKDAYRLQFNEMSPAEAELFKDVVKKIQNKYNFKY